MKIRSAKVLLSRLPAKLGHGRRWIKYRMRSEWGYCLTGAVEAIEATATTKARAHRYLTRAAEQLYDSCHAECFNDRTSTTWPQVRRVIQEAKRHISRFSRAA